MRLRFWGPLRDLENRPSEALCTKRANKKSHFGGAVTASSSYFTRWSQDLGGPFPLQIHDNDDGAKRLEVVLETPAEPLVFTSARSFMVAFHGERFAKRHWTLDRYLGRGRYAAPEPEWGPAIALVSDRPICGDRRITVLRDAPGIDLDRRGHEVAKLLRAGFQGWISAYGYDFDDVLQEVYRKILVANRGKSPWSPQKSSFGHYVHMVARSALSNLHRKEKRRREREQLGLPGVASDGSWGLVDASLAAKSTRGPGEVSDAVGDLQRYIARGPQGEDPYAALAVRLVPYVQCGHTLKEIAGALSVPRVDVSRAYHLLRACAVEWGVA